MRHEPGSADPFCLFRESGCVWRGVPAACCSLLLARRSLLPAAAVHSLPLCVRCIPPLPLARRSLLPTATAAAGRLRAACCLLLAAARCLLLAAARCYLLLLLARCDLLLLLAKSKSNRVQSRREEAHNCLQSPNPTDLGRREEAHTCTLSLNRLRALIDTNWRGATKTGDVPQTQTALGHRSPSGTDRPRALSFDRPRALSIPIPYLSPTRFLILSFLSLLYLLNPTHPL